MEIFVFGSNMAGRHGAGSAKEALANHGAVYGQGAGLQGSSYAIPTKDINLRPLPIDEIRKHINTFVAFAGGHPELTFRVTAIGCGLAGYSPEDIAPLFGSIPSNCRLPIVFTRVIGL